MKKSFISAVFVFGFLAYVAYSNTTAASSNAQAVTVTNTPDTTTSAAPASPATSAGSAPPTNTPSSVPAKVTPTPVAKPVKKVATGQYTDGTYIGNPADAYYGNIQVKVTISGGRLTNVVFLQYPNDRSTSVMINQQAMPMLKAEAIQAQSAKVDGVSGASDSSAAFKESLASALSQA